MSDYRNESDLGSLTSRLQGSMIQQLRHTDDNLDSTPATYQRYSRTSDVVGSPETKGYQSYSRSSVNTSGVGEPRGYSRTLDSGIIPAESRGYQSYSSRSSDIGGSLEPRGYQSYSRTTNIGGSPLRGATDMTSPRGGGESYSSHTYSSSRGDSGLDSGLGLDSSINRGGLSDSYSSSSYRSSRNSEPPAEANKSYTTVQVGGPPPIFNPYSRETRRVDFSPSDSVTTTRNYENGYSTPSPIKSTGENTWRSQNSTSTPTKQLSANITPERQKNRGDMAEYIRIVTITANVESTAKNPDTLKAWASEVAKEIGEQKPAFAVVHLQGLATKNSKTPPIAFYNALVENEYLSKTLPFSKAFLDSENGSEQSGLGSIFFIKDDEETQLWNNSSKSYAPIRGTSPNECMEHLSRCSAVFAKGLFPKDTVPDTLQMRSKGGEMQPNGYLVIKWRLFDKVFTFVNLNLFATPFIPLEKAKEVQSTATLARQDQIQFLLQKLQADDGAEARFWAGSFNTELELTPLLDDLSHFHRAAPRNKEDESGKLEAVNYIDIDGQKLIYIAEDKFDLFGKHDWFFGLGRGCMAKKYNKEIEKDTLKGLLHEHNTYFPPTSHFDYDKREDKDTLNRSRLPAWSDRVLYNQAAQNMMKFDSFSSTGMYYGIVGANKDIGSHKPVALHATICLKDRKFG